MSALGIAATFAGGVGLFLLGMRLLTDGLKVAAGDALRRGLERWTGTRARALGAGVAITAVVQSSSAVTVAAIGFVNAGLISLGNAVWVVFGSNVGTTATGWLVAATGLSLDLKTAALPLVGAGTLLRLTGPLTRRGAIGEVLSGFGLFFLGLGFLQSAFGAIASSADPSLLGTHGLLAMLAHFGAGVVLTILTQSSSAALAVTITAASSGLLPLETAGAMIVGANLGTTSTAVLAALEATPNAKRAAAAHVVFNAVTGAVALTLLPWLLDAISHFLNSDASVSLAIFHTAFNVGGVLLMWPLSRGLVTRLENRFRTKEEEDGKPRHLDLTVLSVPAVALSAIRLEQVRLAHVAASMVDTALGERRPARGTMQRRRAVFDALIAAISEYVQRVDRARIPEEVAAGLEQVMHASQHYVIAVEQAEAIAVQRNEPPDEGAAPTVRPVLEAARDVVARADPARETFDPATAHEAYGALEERYAGAQAEHLRTASRGTLAPRDAILYQQLMADARRAAKHLLRALEVSHSLLGVV